ncbi:MAG: hypothetical protein AMK72_07280 [Planctomycetes bacterium SM23_25]|nr:MAG: hypothetical protein AMS14_04710 [Planctomycetes bacterium DG_20]KPK48322.1 MAG: hypothetical protein AMK72_07280 [Planctomycetes bacterium SM23_25]
MPAIRCLLVSALLLTTCPTALVAGEAEEAFEALFGKECEEVAATRSSDDDVALASKLLKVAKSGDAHPDLAALLYFGDLANPEIAEALHIRVGAVTVALHKARTRLRTLL